MVTKIVHVLLIASQNDMHKMDAAVIDQRNRRNIRFRARNDSTLV